MVDVAEIRIWGERVGAVAWDGDSGYATFEFDPRFTRRGWDLAPLTMPLAEATGKVFSFPQLNPETFRGLPGLLADSLPDRFGNRLIDAWLARNGRSPDSLNSVERLCYTGTRGMGALEYEPALHPWTTQSKPVEIEHLVELARDVLTERNELHTNIHAQPDKGLMDIIRVGTSAGGMRAKAVIAYNRESGDVRSGQVDELDGYDYWIIKFDGVTNEKLGDPQGYGRIEYAYYLMARDCGIEMTESRLLEEHSRAHFLTKRFDRRGAEKLHMQTLCGIAHMDYNDAMSFSYEQAFQVMRRLGLPYPDAERLYRRMCFNVVTRNQDDHTKNISFLMDKSSSWRLSPAYDLTFACNPQSRWTCRHQMSINGKREGVTREDLLVVARRMNIKKPDRIIDEVLHSASKWEQYAASAGVSRKQSEAIGSLLVQRRF